MKNLRKKISLLVSVSVLLMLTGCVDASYNMSFSEDNVAFSSMAITVDLSDVELNDDVDFSNFEERLVDSIQTQSLPETRVTVTEQEKLKYLISVTSPAVALEQGENEILFGSVVLDGFNVFVQLNLFEFTSVLLDGVATPSEVISNFEVKLEFPGNVSTATYGGRIFGKTVQWDKESLLASIEAQEGFSATSSTFPEFSSITIVIAISGLLLALILTVLSLRRFIKTRKQKRLLLGVEKAKTTEYATPEEWAKGLISSNKRTPFKKKDKKQETFFEDKVDELSSDSFKGENGEPFGIQVKMPPLLQAPQDTKLNKKRRK